MTDKILISNLIRNAEAEMIRLGYSYRAIQTSKQHWKDFLNYCIELNMNYYSMDIATNYLRKRFDYPSLIDERHSTSVTYVANSIRKIGDLYLYGRFWGREKKGLKHVTLAYLESVTIYEQYCINRNIITESIHRNKKLLDSLFEYLILNNINSPKDILPLHLSNHVSSLLGYSKRTIETRLSVFRTYFRAIYNEQLTRIDLSKHILSIHFPAEDKLSMVWKEDDIKKIINCIDRGSPYGKRDYAILLLATTYGLRDGDIRKLKLSNILWSVSKIQLIQSKTQELLLLPLIECVGNAIIEYLKYGRPKTQSEHLFVKHKAPYDAITKTGNIMTKYLNKSHITYDKTRHHGIHTLRHTLASRLLEHDVPLEIICGILGHSTDNSAYTYLHLDIENLRKCALEVDCCE